MNIRVVTYNIRSGLQRGTPQEPTAGLLAVAQVLAELRDTAPDPEQFIAFVQEIEVGAPRSGLVDQPTWLEQHLGWETALFFPAFTQSLTVAQGTTDWHFGNALFAPMRLVDERAGDAVVTNQLYRKDYRTLRPEWPSWVGEQRVAAHVAASIGNTALHLCCSHLAVTPDQRERQLKQLTEQLIDQRRPGLPIIVGADFNAGLDHRHFVQDPPHMLPCATPAQELHALCARAGLTDALTHCGVTDDRTYPTPSPSFAFDRVLVSQDVKIIDADVFVDSREEAASDHYAVFADLAVYCS